MTAAIILAAGASTRMGVAKANIPFRNGTFLTNLSERLSAFCHPVIVVVGANAAGVIRPAGAQLVHNPNWPTGQLSSLQAGLRQLPPDFRAVVFTLVDHPDPLPSTIHSLLQSRHEIAVPTFHGHRGHPVKFSSNLAGEFLDSGILSAKDVFRRHSADTEYIPVEDPGITDDVDDPEALARFRERTGAR